ncbi:MAG: hypothetical protein JNL88_08080, partial [Bacteroidia bacterium]|nr:hypothetical protein [Bacteroidia bacterium]
MNCSLCFSVRHYRLEFAHPFGIAHGTRNYTDTLYVRASFMDTHGYGEAALPPYLGYDATQLAADFDRFFPAAMEGSEAIRLVMQKLSKTDEPIPLPLRTAVDIALHDLFGKLTGRTVRSIFGITDTVEALCSYTLGFST